MADGEAIRFPFCFDDSCEMEVGGPFAAAVGLGFPFLTEIPEIRDQRGIPDVPAVISDSPLTSLVRYWREAADNRAAAPGASPRRVSTLGYLDQPRSPPAPFPTFAKHATSLLPYWREVTDCGVTPFQESPPEELRYSAKTKTPPAPFPSFAKYVTSLPPSWREKTECEAVASSETPEYLTSRKPRPAPFSPLAKYVTSLPPCWKEKTECDVIASPETSALRTQTSDCLAASTTSPDPFSPLAKYVTSLPPCWRGKTDCEVMASPETAPLEVEAPDYFTAPKTPPAPFPSFAKYATSLPHRSLSDYELIASARDFVSDVQPNLQLVLSQLDRLVLDSAKASEFDDDIKLNWNQLQHLEAMGNGEFLPVQMENPIALDENALQDQGF